MTDRPEYISIEDAAQMLGVSPRTIRLYISQRRLVGYKRGAGRSAQLVRLVDVEEMAKIVPVNRDDQVVE